MKHICDENGCRIVYDEEDKKLLKNAKKIKKNS